MDADFKYECKAAYLVTFEDVSNVITSKDQLLEGKFCLCFMITLQE